MTYKIEHDELGEEVLYMTAIIQDNIVDLDWAREDNDAAAYVQRGMERFKTLVPDADSESLPRGSAALTLRLCRSGRVIVTNVACSDQYRDEAMRIAKEAGSALYDGAFPEVASQMNSFVLESIANVNHLAADDALLTVAVKKGKEIAADQVLPELLEQAKGELGRDDTVVQRLGWLVKNAMALFPTAIPAEKYRFFQAVSEVAHRVNAQAVVHVSDNYELGPDGERTGGEILLATWINPDGSCISAGVTYTRRKHPLLPHDIIAFSEDLGAVHKGEQSIIPAWGIYAPN